MLYAKKSHIKCPTCKNPIKCPLIGLCGDGAMAWDGVSHTPSLYYATKMEYIVLIYSYIMSFSPTVCFFGEGHWISSAVHEGKKGDIRCLFVRMKINGKEQRKRWDSPVKAELILSVHKLNCFECKFIHYIQWVVWYGFWYSFLVSFN